jgi:pimeloyl-ACP methyl ester carboxylesterase
MTTWRSVSTLLLTVATLFGIVFTLFTGYGMVMVELWEHYPLDYDESITGQWVWIDEQPIYYSTRGWERGPKVVLVHGFQVEGQAVWTSTAQALADAGLYVIAVDLKGFGRSARDTSPNYSLRNQATLLARVLNQLEVMDATIVGHGWGSAVALQLAADQPRFAKQLVLISPRIRQDNMLFWRYLADAPYIDRAVAWVMAAGGPVWSARQRLSFYDYSRVDDAYRRATRQATQVMGTVDALLAMATSPQDKGDIDLGAVRVPVRIVLGQHDGRTARAEAARLEQKLINAQVMIIPEAGHQVQIEQHRVVSRIITELCFPEEMPVLTGIDSPYQYQFSR